MVTTPCMAYTSPRRLRTPLLPVSPVVYGALINAQGGTNGTSIVQAARFEAGGGDLNYGIQLDVEDGGVDLRIESSADSGDYFQIQTTTHGATTITTVDDDATAADLTFTIDGDINLSPTGGDVKVTGNVSGSGQVTFGNNLLMSGDQYIGGALNVTGTSTFSGVSTHEAHPIFETGITIKNADASAGYINFYEQSSNGTNVCTFRGKSSMGNCTITLPGDTGTVVLEDNTVTLSNKTISTPTITGLAKAAALSGSGGLQYVGATILGNTLLVSGNVGSTPSLGLGTSTVHASENNYLSIANGTEPSFATADQISIGSKDSTGYGSGNGATFSMNTEGLVENSPANLADLSHRVSVWINGTEYFIYLDPV